MQRNGGSRAKDFKPMLGSPSLSGSRGAWVPSEILKPPKHRSGCCLPFPGMGDVPGTSQGKGGINPGAQPTTKALTFQGPHHTSAQGQVEKFIVHFLQACGHFPGTLLKGADSPCS